MLLWLLLERLRQEAVPIEGPTFVSIGSKFNKRCAGQLALRSSVHQPGRESPDSADRLLKLSERGRLSSQDTRARCLENVG